MKWFKEVFLKSFKTGKELRISEKQFRIFEKYLSNIKEDGYLYKAYGEIDGLKVEAYDNITYAGHEYTVEINPIEEEKESNGMERIEALAKFLGVEVEDLAVSKFDERTFENEEAGEYIVLTEEEADEAAEEIVRESINDMGLESFTEYFQQWILDTCVDSDWFEDALQEDIESYIEDIRDEEPNYVKYDSRLDEEMDDVGVDTEEKFLECLIENAGDPIEWFKDMFGMEEFTNTCEEYNLIDWESVIEEAIAVDGCGHFIATYDGVENEMDEYFIYRLN